MSFKRKIIRDKIRKKYGNKHVHNVFTEYKNADDKRKTQILKSLETKGKYKKPKAEKFDFEVKYIEKNTKRKKMIVVKAIDKKAARQQVKNMFATEKRVGKERKRIEKVTVKGVKKAKVA